MIRAITPLQALLNIIVQLLAAICAAALVSALTPGPLLVANGLASNVSRSRGVFIEAFLTAQFVLAVFLLCRPPRPHPFAAAGVALSLFMAHMTGINFTGTGVNPARTLGPDVVNGKFAASTWVYYIGPILGALIAAVVFALLRFLNRSSNPQNLGNTKVVRRDEHV